VVLRTVAAGADFLNTAGWQIAGALGRHRGAYRLVDVFNVYT